MDRRIIVLHEPDEAQITANYLRREPDHGEQPQRARASALYGDRLAAQAAEVGAPAVAARPWTDVIDRVIAALGTPSPLERLPGPR